MVKQHDVKRHDESRQPGESQQPGRVAGEYGEGDARQATGVGPRSKGADPKVLNDEHGYPDNYGNVAQGRYGVYGYSGSPGYPGSQPTDERLYELIRERLTEDPGIDASNVTIEVSGGKVTLTGTVATRRARTEVEQCVENCGALQIQNDLGID